MATPCGSPSTDHRRTTFWSRVGIGLRVWGCAKRVAAAEQVSRTRPAILLLDRVGEMFDDSIREKPFTHLSKLRFDVVSILPTVRKRYPKQLADPHIFHPPETERAQQVLNGLPLGVEDGRFELDDDGCFHGPIIARPESRIGWLAATPTQSADWGAGTGWGTGSSGGRIRT